MILEFANHSGGRLVGLNALGLNVTEVGLGFFFFFFGSE